MSRRNLYFGFPLALLLVACAAPVGAPVRVIIPKGASFKTATDSLEKAGIVHYPFFFRMLARVKGDDRNIKPGTYLLKRRTPWTEILSALNGGHGLVNTVTIPEGFGLNQIVPLLARSLQVPMESVVAAVRDTALLRRLDIPTQNLEGYLFPDTYAFPEGTTARQAVGEMVKRFEREWKPDWNRQLTALAMNRHDIVTMASIIEEEAKRPEERPVISAVYHNRLRERMLLQADPTVQYALGAHRQRVLYRDLETDSPYNTYLYPGLPPGPIASPGRASLEATLYPDSVPWLFFFATGEGGRHTFSETFAEHNRKRRELNR